jgi:hypothetical protein
MFKSGVDANSSQQAIVKVKFSPTLFPELIKFDVELDQVPITDGTAKDLIANWKMYDDFDAQGQFFTDSNELEMQKRVLDQKQFIVENKWTKVDPH